MASPRTDVDELEALIRVVIERVGNDWKQLGRALKLSKIDLDGVEEGNSCSLRERIYQTFYLWRRRLGKNATVQSLETALKAGHLDHLLTDELATEICEEETSSPPSKKRRTLSNDSEVEVFKDILMERYSAANLPVVYKWPEMGSNKYIDLVIYEKRDLDQLKENWVTNVKGELENFSDLQKVLHQQVGVDKSGTPCSVCIITGAPGVGKSCFSWRLATKWKEGELFKECRLTMVVRLRDSYIREAKKVDDLIEHDNQQMRENIGNWMTTNNGHGCLLILDGFDELPADLRRESIIRQIISGGKLGKALLIVTTRSTAAKELYRICSRRKCQYLEILGFNKQEIESYVLPSFENDIMQKAFQHYLQCYPNIRSLMCIPLHCAIVSEIYRNQRSQKQAPKTITELYTDIVKVLIIRSLQQDYPALTEEGLDSFNDLPGEAQKCLKELARIAYESTLKDEVQFHNKFLKKMKKLDLLEEEPEIYNLASSSVSYHFVHMTIQEFLAAYHVATLSLDEQSSIIRKELCTRRMAVVLKFVAGLTKFSQLADIHDHIFTSGDVPSLLQCIHCLFETQDPNLIAKVFQSIKVLDFTLQMLSPHDCYALNYCIVMSEVQIDLRLESCNISEEAMTMLLHPILNTANMFHYVNNLVLSKNHCVKSRTHDICAALKRNNCLQSLWMGECSIDSSGVEDIKELLLGNKTISRLVLNVNYIYDQGASALGAGLKGNDSLKILSIRDCRISHVGLQAICEALECNKTLVELNVGDNSIGNSGISLFCTKLKETSALKKLVLHRCSFTADEECIKNLTALCKREEFTLYVDDPVRKILKKSVEICNSKTTAATPYTRNGGCGVIFEGKLFLWGGHTDVRGKLGGMTFLPCTKSHTFDVWDPATNSWSEQPTTGNVPELGLASSLVCYSRWLYIYGGWLNYAGKSVVAGDVYKLSMDTFQWEMIPCINSIKPSSRCGTGVVLYKDKLCMFGGVGPKIVEDQDPGAEWICDTEWERERFGWNNEYYEFDLIKECWSAPLGKDAYRPKPIGSFSFCKFTCNSAILFGGAGSEDQGASNYSNRIYTFDLENRVWNCPAIPSEQWPTGCKFHTLSPLFDPERIPVGSAKGCWMILLWGQVSSSGIGKDVWTLDITTWTWRKLQLDKRLKPRAWHVACPRPDQRDIVVFGGNMAMDDYYSGRCAVADLQLISFDYIEQLLEDHSTPQDGSQIK